MSLIKGERSGAAPSLMNRTSIIMTECVPYKQIGKEDPDTTSSATTSMVVNESAKYTQIDMEDPDTITPENFPSIYSEDADTHVNCHATESMGVASIKPQNTMHQSSSVTIGRQSAPRLPRRVRRPFLLFRFPRIRLPQPRSDTCRQNDAKHGFTDLVLAFCISRCAMILRLRRDGVGIRDFCHFLLVFAPTWMTWCTAFVDHDQHFGGISGISTSLSDGNGSMATMAEIDKLASEDDLFGYVMYGFRLCLALAMGWTAPQAFNTSVATRTGTVFVIFLVLIRITTVACGPAAAAVGVIVRKSRRKSSTETVAVHDVELEEQWTRHVLLRSFFEVVIPTGFFVVSLITGRLYMELLWGTGAALEQVMPIVFVGAQYGVTRFRAEKDAQAGPVESSGEVHSCALLPWQTSQIAERLQSLNSNLLVATLFGFAGVFPIHPAYIYGDGLMPFDVLSFLVGAAGLVCALAFQRICRNSSHNSGNVCHGQRVRMKLDAAERGLDEKELQEYLEMTRETTVDSRHTGTSLDVAAMNLSSSIWRQLHVLLHVFMLIAIVSLNSTAQDYYTSQYFPTIPTAPQGLPGSTGPSGAGTNTQQDSELLSFLLMDSKTSGLGFNNLISPPHFMMASTAVFLLLSGFVAVLNPELSRSMSPMCAFHRSESRIRLGSRAVLGLGVVVAALVIRIKLGVGEFEGVAAIGVTVGTMSLLSIYEEGLRIWSGQTRLLEVNTRHG
ncbi:hypothetical protein BJ742DRAFT_831949 [Cladochytrium replicatum]|nr:hypothetical protein BJ742DRAFT_831949 [Cladochytrium replicatum]